jgi:uncharacterized protein YigA (DUF484 family)
VTAPVEALIEPATGTAMLDHPSAHAVEAYLRDHPEFLALRPDLYRELEPPVRVHGERVADHMAAMLAAERRRLRGLEAEMTAAAQAGRAGGALTMRVRLAVLALMRSQDVVETVAQEVPALLGVETCTLLAEAPDRLGIIKLPRGMVARLLGPGRDAVVRPNPTDRELLHAEAAGLVNRDAIVRVPVWTSQPTVLAVGSRDPGALPARQSTATLIFLGRAVAAALAR